MPELKALARERRLRNYSWLRKTELIALLQDNEHQAQRPPPPPPQRHAAPAPRISTWEPNRPPQMSPSEAPSRGATWEPECEQENEVRQCELEAPLTKRQLKCRQNKDSKIVKKIKNIDADINNLKYQMEELENKITKASQSTNARFKRKKIRSMKCEVDKISKRLLESEKALESLKLRLPAMNRGSPVKAHPPNRNKHLEVKIAELNKKIRRAKNGRTKRRLIAKRDSLRVELNWGPRQLDGAFGGACRRYQIDGIEGMDIDTFVTRTKRFLKDLLSRETRNRAVHSQATTWIRFIKDGIESVDLAFNSRMLAVYNLSDMGEIVSEMINQMQQQIENPALRDSVI